MALCNGLSGSEATEYSLPESEAYDLLELIDACSRKGALILCTQYDVDDWDYCIDCERAEDEGILDRIH